VSFVSSKTPPQYMGVVADVSRKNPKNQWNLIPELNGHLDDFFFRIDSFS